MRRLGLIDRALIFTLVPIWAFWFVLYVNSLANGRVADLPIDVSAPASDSYPMVLGYWPTDEPWGNLRIGDQLIRVGREELRGTWPVRFQFLTYQAANVSLRVPVVLMRAGERRYQVLPLRARPLPWKEIPITLSFVAIAVLLLLRRPGSLLIRSLFVTSMALSFLLTPFEYNRSPIAPVMLTYVWAVLFFISASIWAPLALRCVILFPEQGTQDSKHLPWWPWLFGVYGLVMCSWMVGRVGSQPNAPGHIIFIAWGITFLLVLTRGFLGSDPVGRRQIKWFLYGQYLGIMPMLLLQILTLFKPSLVYLVLIAPIFLFSRRFAVA